MVIKEEYIRFLNKYTSIDGLNENYAPKSTIQIKGKFCNLFDCSTYSDYAIRFQDEMKPEEFKQVYQILVKDLGYPDLFGEYDGYIWRKNGYVITFGLVSLNYNYEVPIIRIKKLNIFETYINYDKYAKIADAICEVLFSRGINIQKTSYYKVSYFRDYGYVVMFDVPNFFVDIGYKKNKLSLAMIPKKRSSKGTVCDVQNKFKKEVRLFSDSDLKLALDSLLEETIDMHGLMKSN